MALRKEQIQYLVLGGIVGAAVLYAAITFGLAPLLDFIDRARREGGIMSARSIRVASPHITPSTPVTAIATVDVVGGSPARAWSCQ